MYPEKNIMLTDEDMDMIKNILSNTLKEEFIETFEKSQTIYMYDCYGLYDYFRISWPDEFKKMNWSLAYRTVSADFNINLDLDTTDLINYNVEK